MVIKKCIRCKETTLHYAKNMCVNCYSCETQKRLRNKDIEKYRNKQRKYCKKNKKRINKYANEYYHKHKKELKSNE